MNFCPNCGRSLSKPSDKTIQAGISFGSKVPLDEVCSHCGYKLRTIGRVDRA